MSTPTEDLVERANALADRTTDFDATTLLNEMAAALQSQADELEAAEADLREAQLASEIARRDRDRAEAEAARLRALLEEAEKVLEPFAIGVPDTWADFHQLELVDAVEDTYDFTASDLRAVTDLLARLKDAGSETKQVPQLKTGGER